MLNFLFLSFFYLIIIRLGNRRTQYRSLLQLNRRHWYTNRNSELLRAKMIYGGGHLQPKARRSLRTLRPATFGRKRPRRRIVRICTSTCSAAKAFLVPIPLNCLSFQSSSSELMVSDPVPGTGGGDTEARSLLLSHGC